MATSNQLMTFEEFAKLPDHPGGHYELHHGEVIFVPPPKHKHHRIQHRLLRLLMTAAGDTGEVSMEFGFRPRGEKEYWVADVVYLPKHRWDAIPLEGIFSGSPDLVVEVLSPSNAAAEIRDKKKLCLETGAQQFWVVDADTRQVEVSTPDGRSVTYSPGQQIPLFFGGSIAVDEIFA